MSYRKKDGKEKVTWRGPMKDEVVKLPENWTDNVHLTMLGSITKRINSIDIENLKKERFEMVQQIREGIPKVQNEPTTF